MSTHRASWAEYQRLRTTGVNPATAAVLAAGQPPRPDDERAYWRQLARGTPTTLETRTAHATAQRHRRRARSLATRPDAGSMAVDALPTLCEHNVIGVSRRPYLRLRPVALGSTGLSAIALWICSGVISALRRSRAKRTTADRLTSILGRRRAPAKRTSSMKAS
jgi:hypothetical protein